MKRVEQITRVVTPIDFSDNSKVIAESAAFVAASFQAELMLVFIVQKFEDYSGFFVPQMNVPDLERDLHVQAESRMDTFCKEMEEFVQGKGVTAVSGKVMMGDVAEQIVSYAGDDSGNMIVMGTHGYKGLEKIMFGSVADKVVKSAFCPVLTINPYTCCGG